MFVFGVGCCVSHARLRDNLLQIYFHVNSYLCKLMNAAAPRKWWFPSDPCDSIPVNCVNERTNCINMRTYRWRRYRSDATDRPIEINEIHIQRD